MRPLSYLLLVTLLCNNILAGPVEVNGRDEEEDDNEYDDTIPDDSAFKVSDKFIQKYGCDPTITTEECHFLSGCEASCPKGQVKILECTCQCKCVGAGKADPFLVYNFKGIDNSAKNTEPEKPKQPDTQPQPNQSENSSENSEKPNPVPLPNGGVININIKTLDPKNPKPSVIKVHSASKTSSKCAKKKPIALHQPNKQINVQWKMSNGKTVISKNSSSKQKQNKHAVIHGKSAPGKWKLGSAKGISLKVQNKMLTKLPKKKFLKQNQVQINLMLSDIDALKNVETKLKKELSKHNQALVNSIVSHIDRLKKVGMALRQNIANSMN